MGFWIKYFVAALAFIGLWAGVGSEMEAIGVEQKYAYATFGAIWGMLWVGVLSGISD